MSETPPPHTDSKGYIEADSVHVAHGEGMGHVSSVKQLLGVWGALIVLTVLTVAAVKIDLGSLNLLLAMGIATAKAVLVALFFMHLLYDRPLNRVVFLTAILFVALFVSVTLIDTMEYQDDLIPDYAPALER